MVATRSSSRGTQDRPAVPSSHHSMGSPPPALGATAILAAPTVLGLQPTARYTAGSPQARLCARLARLRPAAPHEVATKTGRCPENDPHAVPILLALWAESMTQGQASEAAGRAGIAIDPKTLRNRAELDALVPAHVSPSVFMRILEVDNEGAAMERLEKLTYRNGKMRSDPDFTVYAMLVEAVARSLMAKPDLAGPGYDPVALACKVLDELPAVRPQRGSGAARTIAPPPTPLRATPPRQSEHRGTSTPWPQGRRQSLRVRGRPACQSPPTTNTRIRLTLSPAEEPQGYVVPEFDPNDISEDISPVLMTTPGAQGAGLQANLGHSASDSDLFDFNPFNFRISGVIQPGDHLCVTGAQGDAVMGSVGGEAALLTPPVAAVGTPLGGSSLAPATHDPAALLVGEPMDMLNY